MAGSGRDSPNRLNKSRPASTPSSSSSAPQPQPNGRDFHPPPIHILMGSQGVQTVTVTLRQSRLDEHFDVPANRAHSAQQRPTNERADSRGGGMGQRSHTSSNTAGPPPPQPSWNVEETVSNARLDEATLSRNPNRAARAKIADETLEAIQKDQAYPAPQGRLYDLKDLNKQMETKLYSHNDPRLAGWEDRPVRSQTAQAKVEFRERSTVESARDWAGKGGPRVGVLNFASAKKRGGGFRSGAQAQEESIARASNLYLSLISEDSDPFYQTHLKDDKRGYYSHTMIYTKNVALIRDHQDQWAPPVFVDIVTSAAVNAGSVRTKAAVRREEDFTRLESQIQNAMFDRMGRVLKLFEDRGDKVLILGSFGTGVFQNSIPVVARCWAELLGPGARFSASFEFIEFAIIGGPTFREFQKAYETACSQLLMEAFNAQDNGRK